MAFRTIQTILNSKYKNYYLFGLLAFIITPLFSIGYHNHDEHFQILEFCNYKLGLSSSEDLAWEFEARIRPTMQPFIAFSFAKILSTFGIYSPFILSFLLRFLMAVFSWYVLSSLVIQLSNELDNDYSKKALVLCCFFLWFMPYLMVRFSAENFAALFLGIACIFLFRLQRSNVQKSVLYCVVAGFCLGIAWFARIQLGLAYIGLFIWMVFFQKWHIRYWGTIIFFAAVAVMLNVLVDYWFYNDWIFTPYNYFKVNIIENVAAHFGVSPWWAYFEFFVLNAIPPVSIILMFFFFRGLRYNPKHLFSLMLITFFIGHSLVGHKEMRFLFPLVYPFIFIVCTGIGNYAHYINKRKVFRITLNIVIVLNMGLLIYRALSPAQETVKYYKYIYSVAEKEKITLLCLNSSPYRVLNILQANFYKHKNLTVIELDSADEIETSIEKIDKNRQVYLYNPRLFDPSFLNNYTIERVYSPLPDWVLNFNFNDWQSRTKIGAIYKVSR